MRKKQIVIIVFGVILLLTPLAYQTHYLQADESDYYSKVRKGLQYFQKAYERVQSHYVEEIDPYEFVKAGIEGMLGALDPYTVFIEQEGETRLRIITTGKYGGLGMEIGIRNGRATIISPMDNSPAQKAGVLAGDIVEEVNGINVSKLSLEKISQRLRGPIGSEVKLTIKRPGYTGEIIMTIKRAEIIIEDVNYADFVSPGIAYVRLTGFTDKAGSELRRAVWGLGKNDQIDAMILDLRGNSGGLLEAAVEVLGVFLPNGTQVVSTKGFRDGEQEFSTHTEPILLNTPLAVLVDKGSASASEIVAGALQDLDRAIIIGTKTFGKGLVQKIYNIDKNSSTKIKVTTAKYYIPSGRCVQEQDYTANKTLFYNGKQDTVDSEKLNTLFYTSNNREVYEHGGVTPDRILSNDEIHFVIMELWRQSMIFNFAVEYHQKHPEKTGEIEITDSVFDAFLSYVKDREFTYQIEGENELISFIETARESKMPQDIIDTGDQLLDKLNTLKSTDMEKNKEKIKMFLLSELAEKYYGNHERIRYSLKNDKQLKEAINIIHDESEYKKILAIK